MMMIMKHKRLGILDSTRDMCMYRERYRNVPLSLLLTKSFYILVALLLLFIFIDVSTTLLAVHYYKIAYEENKYVIFLWNHFGVGIATLLWCIQWYWTIAFIILGFMSRHTIISFGCFLALCFGIGTYVPTIINNLSILIRYWF